MNAPQDPEDRIRDLEPPVGNAGPYPDGAAPTPPWSYETPAPVPTSGADRRWVSNLLFGLGLLIIVGGTAGYLLFAREPAPPTPTSTPDPSGGRVVITPTDVPTSPAIPAPPTIRTVAPTAPAGAPMSISGIDEHQTVACDGYTVEVSGISNTIVITGHCTHLSVSGIENVVTVDSADVIDASGIQNQVTFHSGSPQVDTSGDNTVEQG